MYYKYIFLIQKCSTIDCLKVLFDISEYFLYDTNILQFLKNKISQIYKIVV